jgi:branched-chain amino acid transport system substrate-binding protein
VFSQVVPNPSATTSVLQNEHLTMMKRFRDEEVSSMTLEGFAVAKSLVKAVAMSRNGNLQNFVAHKANIDLGGLSILPTSTSLSNYVDIALLRKGRSLMF